MPSKTAPSAPPLLWPPALRRPTSLSKLIYLDLNHWIHLAQAATGHPDGPKYLPILQQCRAARANGTALFPLAGVHYEEVAKITDPGQRFPLATLMEELSGFTTLLARSQVMRLELDAVLTPRIGPASTPPAPLDLLGPGYGWAMGKLHPLRIHNSAGDDVTEQVREQIGLNEFDAMIGALELATERAMLSGPNDQDAAVLRARGWDPLAAKQVADARAAQEQSFQDGLDDQTRRRRAHLRDIIMVRELFMELKDALREAVTSRGRISAGVISDAIGHDKTTSRALIRSMPGTEVSTTLKVEDHRNSSKRWECNDIFDIDALSQAVPYCDIVVTDGHRNHILRTAHLDQRMNTVILADLSELPAHL